MAQQKRHHKSGNRPPNRNNNNNRNQGRNDNRNRNDNQHRNDNRNGGGQHQQADNAPKKESKGKAQSKTESSNDLIIFIVFLIALATFFLVRKFYFKPKQNSLYAASANLKFMKEGTLTFLDAQTDDKMISIEIEVSESAYEIERGLMHRRSLPANGGMPVSYTHLTLPTKRIV